MVSGPPDALLAARDLRADAFAIQAAVPATRSLVHQQQILEQVARWVEVRRWAPANREGNTLPRAAGCDYFGGTLPLGVTGNTPDSGSGESWFEPRRGNLDRRAVRPPVFVCPSGLAVAYASPSSPGGAT